MSTPLSLWIEGFSFFLFFHLHVLLLSFTSSFFSPQWCLSSFFHSFLFDVSFCVCIIYPLFYPFHSFSSLHLYSWASLHYQGVFTSTLLSLSLCLSLFSPLFSSILLFPLSSHFHATHWAATLSVFISVCGRGGSPVPATNGLLENTDSHASQSGELHREKEKEDLEGSQRESDLGQRRKQTNEGKSDSEEKK